MKNIKKVLKDQIETTRLMTDGIAIGLAKASAGCGLAIGCFGLGVIGTTWNVASLPVAIVMDIKESRNKHVEETDLEECAKQF